MQEVSTKGYFFTDGSATKMMRQIVEKGYYYPEHHLCEKEILFLQLICSEKTYKEIADSYGYDEKHIGDVSRNKIFKVLSKYSNK